VYLTHCRWNSVILGVRADHFRKLKYLAVTVAPYSMVTEKKAFLRKKNFREIREIMQKCGRILEIPGGLATLKLWRWCKQCRFSQLELI